MLQVLPSLPITVGVLSIIPAFLYFVYSKSGKEPKLCYVKSTFTEYILQQCWRLRTPFFPTIWAQNRHLQTLVGSVQPRAHLGYDREFVDLPDGGCCALDWVVNPNLKSKPDPIGRRDKPIFIAIPGLTGDAKSMSHLCLRAFSRGYRPVVFNKRGHGGSRLRTPKVQSFGDPEDLYVVVKHIRAKFPNAVLTALGSSAGSGLLASYLGEYGPDCILSYAVFVSPGYDAEFLFKHCIKHPYDFLLMSMLKKLLRSNKDVLAKVVDMNKVMAARNLITLEEDLYCSLYGYTSMKEYWQHNNPVRNPKNMSIPMLSISSLDDPVCTKECIDYSIWTKTRGEAILVTTDHGGHCGFLEGWNLEHWADKLALDYLDACLKYRYEMGKQENGDVK